MINPATIRPPRYFVSMYTDGPATSWNVIDRQTQEWVRRFSSKEDAAEYAKTLTLAPARRFGAGERSKHSTPELIRDASLCDGETRAKLEAEIARRAAKRPRGERPC